MFGSVRGAAGLAALALILTGCSSGGGTTPSASETTATTAPEGANVIPAEFFGTHVGLLGVADQPMPARAGAIRLWDSGVAWREIEPTEGVVNWAPLDAAVSKAEAMGAKDILWVHGSPPAWAAEDPEAKGIYGPGTSSAPKEKPYLEILRQVAERYKGKIKSFQVWNEANIKIFYRGTPQYMAELTQKAKAVLAEVDPQAQLISASTTVREDGPFKPFYEGYTKALAAMSWPVDAMAVHLYPLADQGPDTRDQYIRTILTWLADRGWTGPVWDTEMNFGDRRDMTKPADQYTVPPADSAAFVARAYLDALALGIDRVYWYTWNDHSLGIDQVDAKTGAVLPAGQAYLTLQDWLVGATWEGCTGEIMTPTGTAGAVSTCSATLADGRKAQILWATSKTAVGTPVGAQELCYLDGKCESLPSVGTLTVGPEPVMVRFG